MSDKETTDNFLEFWKNFKWPEIVPISYRCYYLENGDVDFYTMEDLPGNYIEVEQSVYVLAPFPAKVIDGKLVIIKQKKTVQKLTPSSDDGTMCHKKDVGIVVDNNGVHWKYKTNEID